MLRSMFAAITGLRAHQTMMDVVGNNISNVNTVGYKASRTTFQDAMSQVLRGSSGLQEGRGGTNAMQIGLGAAVSSIDQVFTQGSVQLTGRNTDLAIQGEGFFVVSLGGQTMYTRAGSFSVDSSGALVGPSGARVMGWMADATGGIDTQQPVGNLSLPAGQVIAPTATENVVVGGNLPAGVVAATEVNTSISVYDAQGNAHDVVMTFTKTGLETDNTWNVTGTLNGDPLTLTPAAVEFDAAGALIVPDPAELTFDVGTEPVTVSLATPGQELVQYGGQTTAEARSQDGTAMGFLRGFEFAADGSVIGRFSNGQTRVLGAVAIATFNNPAGLSREGENLFGASLNSGPPAVGVAGQGDAGVLSPGSLEMGNVDLAQEFTNLIIAQRGFQANSRSITASDELLHDIVNLKR